VNREEILYLLPYLLSLTLTLGILIYTWRHRHARGARIYSWFVGGQTLTIMGFILELISPNLQTKLLWDKFQWLTDSFLVFIPFLIFSIQFSEHKLRRPRLTWGYWIGLPILFTILLLTDNQHHLLYVNPRLLPSHPFSELQYGFTFVVYLYVLFYVYAANFYGISLLIKRAIQPYNPHRLQYRTIVIGFLIPLVLTVFALFDFKIAPQRDFSPFSLAIGNMVVAWGLFRYGLFDIVPIAREHIVENMLDPVIVLDGNNRVVDINPSALDALDKQRAEVIGHLSSEVFAKWPGIVNELENLNMEPQEMEIQGGDHTLYFDLNISSVQNKSDQLLGKAIVARDVTRQKTLEAGYRTLSEDLEQRVRERTDELRNTAERYRAVVENQTEFIVRWRPDGKRTFVNEAYCRYFGLTQEQAIASGFLPQVAEEDRNAVQEKISRLTSGAVKAETEIHRVIKSDGSIGWQEWTDQAIRDESGNLIEFQSIGRDITQRKQDEQIILKQLSFDTLMTRLLTDFATCSYDEVDAGIDNALQEITKFFGGDYADILFLSEDKKMWKSTHHWITPQLEQSIQPASNIKVGDLIWSERKLVKGESVRISTLDDYPPEALPDRRFAEKEGVKSLLSVPIRGKEESVFGVLDIVSYNRHITWSDGDVTHLKIVGDAIVNTLERKRAEENLAEAYETTLEGWAKALELRDKETEGHSRRVTEKTLAVARAMGISKEELVHIRRGSILHDIGKMGIPDDILRKNGPLTDEEQIVVYKHPTTAFNLLKPITYLKKSLDVPYCHHEKWDGSGYPRGLKGTEIPLAARIFAVVDVWDALSSDRPYRNAWPQDKVVQYLMDESGKHFDPAVVRKFVNLVNKGKI
jgi:PAS domain S-box-containing protein